MHWIVIIMPNQIGSMPAAMAGPKKIGVTTTTAISGSTTIPAIKKNTVTHSNIVVIEGLLPNTPLAIICGTFAYVRTRENICPLARRMNRVDVTAPVDNAIFPRSFILTVRYITISRIAAYSTEIAAASVGLAFPE